MNLLTSIPTEITRKPKVFQLFQGKYKLIKSLFFLILEVKFGVNLLCILFIFFVLRSFLIHLGNRSQWDRCSRNIYRYDWLQSNLYKTTTLWTTQKWSSWKGGRLIKILCQATTNQIWSFLAGFSFFFHRWMFYKK